MQYSLSNLFNIRVGIIASRSGMVVCGNIVSLLPVALTNPKSACYYFLTFIRLLISALDTLDSLLDCRLGRVRCRLEDLFKNGQAF